MKKSQRRPRNNPRRLEQVIVLKDGAGNYYEISRANLVRSKVSAARKKKLKRELMSPPGTYSYIRSGWIPGSIAAPKFKGGKRLHYGGYYLRPRRKR